MRPLSDVQRTNEHSRLNLCTTTFAFSLWCDLDNADTRRIVELCAIKEWGPDTSVKFLGQNKIFVETFDGRQATLTRNTEFSHKNALPFDNYYSVYTTHAPGVTIKHGPLTEVA